MHRGYKVIYRRYASLYFILGIDPDEEVICIKFFNLKNNKKKFIFRIKLSSFNY